MIIIAVSTTLYPLTVNSWVASNGIFNFEMNKVSEKVSDLSIYDLSGHLLEVIPIKTTRSIVREQLDLTNYAAGIYFLKVEVDGEVLSEKLMKVD